jgi:hypothetical protein
MAGKPITMKAGNKGLTVKINLWALDEYKDEFDAESARLWVKGMVTHADTGESKMFNDPGELITILGKWNVAKLKALKEA